MSTQEAVEVNPNGAPGAFSLCEIAAWQIPALPPVVSGGRPRVALPALQRGAVWKPHQVELLWDSLARGFPIGSLLLAPYDGARGEKQFKFQGSQSDLQADAKYHLLDGQQRANAVALGFLGFLDPRDDRSKEAVAALWVDIGAPPEGRDTRFVFRVLTRSHPWGYRRGDATKRLASSQMHDAMAEFAKFAPTEFKEKSPAQMPLRHTWPKDAEAPVPLYLLLRAIAAASGKNPWDTLRADPAWDDALNRGLPWATAVSDRMRDEKFAARFEELCRCLSAALGRRIPAQVVPPMGLEKPQNAPTDPLETLFVRISTAGTRIGGEELMYTILKSAWPEAAGCVERLQFKVVPAPRLVLLFTRLLQSQEKAFEKSPPPPPDVKGFRRLVARGEFRNRLQKLFEDRGRQIVSAVKQLLEGLEDEEFGLPTIVSCGIARNHPDVFFLLLSWIDRMQVAGKDPCKLRPEQRRRLIGMVTAIAWFSGDSVRCLSALWERLNECDPQGLENFFSADTLRLTHQIGASGRPCTIPLVPPEFLDEFLKQSLFGDGAPEWKKWNWAQHVARAELPQRADEWYKSWLGKAWATPNGGEAGAGTPPAAAQALRDLVGRLADWRRRDDLLLYAQRELLGRCFKDFDPSLPEQMEDINRPWDYDHIHPSAHVVGRWHIPEVVRNWHGTVGNLRAWPFDLNRSDHDASPATKFSDVDEQEKQRYGVEGVGDKLRLSFMPARKDEDNGEWKNWEKSAPEGGLANSREGQEALVRAITTRFVRVYREWYVNLRIGDLYGDEAAPPREN